MYLYVLLNVLNFALYVDFNSIYYDFVYKLFFLTHFVYKLKKKNQNVKNLKCVRAYLYRK
jgi:amino acid transporter